MPDKLNSDSSPTSAPAPAGGFKAWLPLLVTVVAMPALAYGTIQMLILPKLQQAMVVSAAETEPDLDGEEPGAGVGAATTRAGSGPAAAGSGRRGPTNVRLDKLVVNVSGTMGTRFLMASITVVGTRPGFKDTVEANRDQLMDLAASTLSSKTIADLERPGARNLLKTELISVINNAMGENLVRDIYIPEMAIQ
jgi:flagellar protein FliL